MFHENIKTKRLNSHLNQLKSLQLSSLNLQLKLQSFGKKTPTRQFQKKKKTCLGCNVAQGATGSFHFGIGLPDFASTKTPKFSHVKTSRFFHLGPANGHDTESKINELQVVRVLPRIHEVFKFDVLSIRKNSPFFNLVL